MTAKKPSPAPRSLEIVKKEAAPEKKEAPETEAVPEMAPVKVPGKDGEISIFPDFLSDKKRKKSKPKSIILDNDYVRQLQNLKGIGLTYEQIACAKNISIETLNAMFRAIPALKAEVERGAVLAIKKVRAVHFQNVINSPNPQDQVGWDYMRGGAKNPNRLELRDDKGKKQAPEAIKPEARAAMVKSLF